MKEELRKHCAVFGTIEGLTVKASPHSDYSFAFLDYENDESGIQCVQEYQILKI